MTRQPREKDPNKLTRKQIALATTVAAGNDDGTWCDLDQVLARLPYETSKESLQFSIRILVDRGLIIRGDREKRRGQGRRILMPTDLAKQMFGKQGTAKQEPAPTTTPVSEVPVLTDPLLEPEPLVLEQF